MTINDDLDLALVEASSAGDTAMVDSLLSQGARVLTESHRAKEMATSLGYVILSPNAQDSLALRLAASHGHAECVALLIGPADSKHASSAALSWAARKGHAECVRLLIPAADLSLNGSALLLAAGEGHAECVELLLPVSDFNVNTALHVAAEEGHAGCVALLSPHCSVAFNTFCLQLSAGNGHAECVLALIPASEPLASDPDVFFAAVGKGYASVVAVMLSHDPSLLDLLELSSASEAYARGRTPELGALLASALERQEISAKTLSAEFQASSSLRL